MRTNWSANYTFTAKESLEPAVAEIEKIVREKARSKALGTGHSFNSIADSTGCQISTRQMQSMTLNRESGVVTIGAGVTYGTLAPWLDAQGFALHNLASLPHISVAGACSTATHGSGIHNGNLATIVSAIEFVDGSGARVTLSRAGNPGQFEGAVVGLGTLGILTALTLDVRPSFQMAQVVYENLSFDQLERNLDAIFGAAYSVSLFTDWLNHRATQVWLKEIVSAAGAPPAPLDFYGATLQKGKLHPIAGHSPENCTDQLGVPGPWYDRLPHFRMNFTPSSGAELQTEYFVPRDRAYEAILAVERLRDIIAPHLLVTELRSVAADSLWMSMAYERDSVAIHFTWKPEWESVQHILPRIEKQLSPFQARPHWGKLFTTPHETLLRLYPKLPDFQGLAKQYDRAGRFRNEFLDRVVYGEGTPL